MASPTLDRRDVLAVLFPNPGEYLFVSGLAGSARDAAELTNDGANLFTMAGTMGAAVPMGLGIALAAPEARVAVITGDGEMLMNVGSLATVATLAPKNLSIVCIDNGCHGETGGQPGHTAMNTDLALMAKGAGLASVMTANTADDLAAGAKFLIEAAAPRLLVVRVTDGPPTAYVRDLDPAACRLRFRQAYLGRG
ncbi:MAG: thiamine pyrophosphate-binding protein [Proteobacteria bacterium]|nr:thiamine pyrophosphate-binding protein [Pseudomonadota bacterium]